MRMRALLSLVLLTSVHTATIEFQYSLVPSSGNEVVVSDPSQTELALHFQVSVPRTFWQSDDSEACVRVSHDNGYVDSCYYVYNYTKRILHVHGVTGPIKILARVENRGLEKSVVGEEKALNLYLYDSSGNSKGELKDEALFHPESGSLPLVYTGNLSSAMSIIPKRLSVSLLSTGTGDSVNAYRFERVGFDAEKSEVYVVFEREAREYLFLLQRNTSRKYGSFGSCENAKFIIER